jgi:hypothetical protein
MPHEIIPQQLAIRSMRSSGYRDTAHAIAELIDNSIQAGDGVNPKTEVEVLCVDRKRLVNARSRKQLDEIAVYDNACGMDAKTLRDALQFGNGTRLTREKQKGIGKFGMGLPNASISQCSKLEVWSWRDGKCYYTYLDVEQIEKGAQKEVPEPKEQKFPERWRSIIRDGIGEHGTLVVWTQLDRVTWKGSKALLENSEFLVGRIYRYFISEGKARIRLAAFEEEDDGLTKRYDQDVRPNDPMYLMRGTSAPDTYKTEPAFDLLGEYPIQVGHQGQEHTVVIRYAVARPAARQQGGNSHIGMHAAKNQGVSVVRARRELELNNSFDSRSDPRDRWWGIEVLFEPELDDVFGVTNNKQAATSFRSMSLEDDATAEGMTAGEFRDRLRDSNDPRLVIYEISAAINKLLSETLWPQIKRMAEPRKQSQFTPPPGSAEDAGTKAVTQRRSQIGDKGASDKAEKLPVAEREKELREELVSEGVPEAEAKQLAVEYVKSNVKFLFQESEIPGTAMFDVRLKAGTILVIINSKHPAREHFFDLLKKEGTEIDTPAQKALKLLLSAWARLEDEAAATPAAKQKLEDIRSDWGRLARDFLQAANE